MGNYYCMMAGLPDITLESKLGVSIPDLKEEMSEALTDADKRLMFYFFLETDCKNLVKLLKNPDADIDANGNFDREELEELIASARATDANDRRFPAFMSEFARNYDNNKDTEGWYAEDEMQIAFYEYAQHCSNGMISEWYGLNQSINNILTAMIARKNGWNVSDFIKGEDEITDMIRTNNTKDFNLSGQFDYVAELMKIVDCEDPVEKEKQIDAFKWLWLEDKTFFDGFSIEAVFAYVCKVAMLTRWEKLDVEQGQATFRQIIEDLRGEAKVPEEFTTFMPKN